MSPASSPPAASTLEQWLPRLPGLHHHQRHHLPGSRCEEGTRGGGSRGHGEERGQEGQAGVRNYEEFLVLLYSTRKLSTATTSSYISCSYLCTVSLYLAIKYTQFTLASHSCLTTIPCALETFLHAYKPAWCIAKTYLGLLLVENNHT